MFGLTKKELVVLRKLNTPIKIQNFLDSLPLNFETEGETYMSVRRTLRERTAHCLEGALLAAAALLINGERPLLLDLKTLDGDDHVVALYRRGGRFGAVSKTNHATVRFRDPIYKTARELAASYFHEYFSDATGQKILASYSRPFDLKKVSTDWLTGEGELNWLAEAIDRSRHYSLYPKSLAKFIRPADKIERRAGLIREWGAAGKAKF